MAYSNAALLVIDAQKIYTDPSSEMYCEDASTTLDKINRLVAYFKNLKRPVIYVRHVHDASGSDIGHMFDYAGDTVDFNFRSDSSEVDFSEGLLRTATDPVFSKTRYSAFEGTPLQEILSNLDIQRIVVVGFMTNFCCESTAREAHDKDYFVTFVPDATGTPALPEMNQDEVRRVVSLLLSAGFAVIASTDEVLASDVT